MTLALTAMQGLTALLALPAAAPASGDDVVRDCTDDGRMSKRYSQKEYRHALANLPTDVDEYSDCRDVIRRAQLGAAGGRSGAGRGGSGGPGAAADPGAGGGGATSGATDPLAGASVQERAAVQRAAIGGGAPVAVAGEVVKPGSLGAAAKGLEGLSTIPTPLLVVLGLLCAAGLWAGGEAVSRLVRARGQS